MAGLLDLLGETTGNEIALRSQGACDDECILGRGRLEGTQVPEGVRAIFRECPPVEGQEIGLAIFCAHCTQPCGHYEREGDTRQVTV